MKLLYGTGNPAKLSVMRKKLETLGIELIGLKDLDKPIPDVPENGTTPLENARQKATAYYHAFHMPVFSCDSGLYFDNVPETLQPGVHVRMVKNCHFVTIASLQSRLGNECAFGTVSYKVKNYNFATITGSQGDLGNEYALRRRLSDEEMLLYYSGLAHKYGTLTAVYKNAICLILDEGHRYEAMDASMESERFLITETPHSIIKAGFPLDSLSIDIKTGKYYYDLPEERLEQVAVEDGFLAFFKQVLEQIKEYPF